MPNEKGLVVMYQPQLETFDGRSLTARAAVSVTPAGKDEPVFGTVWLEAAVDTALLYLSNTEDDVLLDIEDTELQYAANTPKQVIRYGDQ